MMLSMMQDNRAPPLNSLIELLKSSVPEAQY